MTTIMNELIQTNIDLCYELIPNFLIPVNLIIIDVYISNKKFKALIDTGASSSILFKKTVDKCNLNYIVDIQHNDNMITANGTVESKGYIWYIDININNFSIPCTFNIMDTIDNSKFDMILGLNFLVAHNINIDFRNKVLIFNNNFSTSFNINI